MLRDLTNPKKIDKQVVLAAISALRARAWDINPYTVADEMKTARTNIYRNSEAMELINEARQQAGLPAIHADDAVTEPNQEISEAQHSVEELKERIQQLENENIELQELQRDNWQRGYKAGWDEASIYLANAAPFPTEPVSEYFNEPETTTGASDVPETFNADTTDSAVFQDFSQLDNQEPVTSDAWHETFAESPQYTESQHYPDSPQYIDPAPEEAEEAVSTEELQNILKQHRDKTEVDPGQGKAKGLAASKFARPTEPVQRGFILRTVPPDIRKSCLVLGIRPEELSRQVINDAWKREITRPGTHPDQGGDSEIAVYLNTAKDVLLRWWETQEPKLGKQFGSQSKPTQADAESEPDETER